MQGGGASPCNLPERVARDARTSLARRVGSSAVLVPHSQINHNPKIRYDTVALCKSLCYTFNKKRNGIVSYRYEWFIKESVHSKRRLLPCPKRMLQSDRISVVAGG